MQLSSLHIHSLISRSDALYSDLQGLATIHTEFYSSTYHIV